MPAPTAAIVWCQKMRSAAKSTPAAAANQRSRRGRGPYRLSSRIISRASSGRAYAQRKVAAVAGDVSASRTSVADAAMAAGARDGGEHRAVGQRQVGPSVADFRASVASLHYAHDRFEP